MCSLKQKGIILKDDFERDLKHFESDLLQFLCQVPVN